MLKRVSVFLLSLTFVLNLTGCSQDLIVEQTNNELNIYMDNSMEFRLEAAVRIYNQNYPDVKVNITKEQITDIENKANEMKKLSTQIMSGKGPDIFPIQDWIWDIEKMVRSGAFADLNLFFENDETFDESKYNTTVMDGGIWDNKRLIVPLEYNIPVLITSENALKETGFDIDNTKNAYDFMKETNRIMDDKTKTRRIFRQSSMMKYFPCIMGFNYLDYDNKQVNIETPEFKAAFEWYKKNLKQDAGDNMYGEFYAAEAIYNGEVLFEYPVSYSLLNGLMTNYRAINTFDKAVMVPMNNINGGLNAKITSSVGVANNSPNIQNAYNFIKILLSDELNKVCVNNQTDLSVYNLANNYVFESRKHPADYGKDINGFTQIPELSEEDYKQYMDYVNEIDNASFYQSKIHKYMQPYLKDEKSYEECLEIAKEKMKIYISE